jgi:hypothetical protein
VKAKPRWPFCSFQIIAGGGEISNNRRSLQSAPPPPTRACTCTRTTCVEAKEECRTRVASRVGTRSCVVSRHLLQKYVSRCVATCIAAVSLAPVPRCLLIIKRDLCGGRCAGREQESTWTCTRHALHSRVHVRHRPLQACKQPRREHRTACSWRKRVAPAASTPMAR